MNQTTHRNIAQRHRVTGLDRRIDSRLNSVAYRDAFRRDYVASLAVSILQQDDVCRTVRIIFDALDSGFDAVLVALEINDPILLLVAATYVSSGDPTLIITASGLALFLQERTMRFAAIQVRIRDLYDESSPR